MVTETKISEGYKKAEAGIIPEKWKLVRLADCIEIISGQIDPKKPPFCNLTLVAPNHIETGSGRLLCKETAKEQNAISGKYLFKPNDVVYSKIRPYLCKAFLADFEGLCSADMYVLRSKKTILPQFLLAKILSEDFTRFANAISMRTGIPKLNKDEFSEYYCPIPPLPEQHAIAEALGDVDALIAAYDKLITKKRNIKQGVMQQLLTGNTRLPGFSGEWEVKVLGEAVEFLDGKRQPIKDADRAKMRGQYPYYGASGIIDYVNDYIFDDNLILLGEDGENIISRNCRLAFQISGKVWVNNHAHVLKPKPDTNITFLTEYLESLNYEQYNTGTAQPKLNKKVCASIPVLLPSLNEQQAIAHILNDMDAEIEALEQKREKYTAIKQGMMQKLLTGRIRLGNDRKRDKQE